MIAAGAVKTFFELVCDQNNNELMQTLCTAVIHTLLSDAEAVRRASKCRAAETILQVLRQNADNELWNQRALVLSICSRLLFNRSCGLAFVYGGLMCVIQQRSDLYSLDAHVGRYTVLEFHSKAVRMVTPLHSPVLLNAPAAVKIFSTRVGSFHLRRFPACVIFDISCHFGSVTQVATQGCSALQSSSRLLPLRRLQASDYMPFLSPQPHMVLSSVLRNAAIMRAASPKCPSTKCCVRTHHRRICNTMPCTTKNHGATQPAVGNCDSGARA
jgi:hypothetical protein